MNMRHHLAGLAAIRRVRTLETGYQALCDSIFGGHPGGDDVSKSKTSAVD